MNDGRGKGGNRSPGSLANNDIASPINGPLLRHGGYDSVPEGLGDENDIGLIHRDSLKRIISLPVRNRPVKLDAQALENHLYALAAGFVFRPAPVSVSIEEDRAPER
jgi:hypothetical protein